MCKICGADDSVIVKVCVTRTTRIENAVAIARTEACQLHILFCCGQPTNEFNGCVNATGALHEAPPSLGSAQ